MGRATSREWMKYAACLAGLWALLLGVYALAGSFHAEFSGPDEAAYVVSSVMVREYLGGALWSGQWPLQFAQQYYAHYPKVAIGHWPPTYFLVEGVWLIVTGVSRHSVLALSALTSATLALTTVYFCRREGLRWTMAVTAGVVASLLPVSLDSLIEIGSDVFTGIAILIAALYCERWIDKQTMRGAVVVGVAMAVAILCKGTAFALLMMVPLALLLARKRLSVWWEVQTWVPVVVAMVLALPWYYFAHELLKDGVVPGPAQTLSNEVAPGGENGMISLIMYAARSNTGNFVLVGGIGLSVLALLSLRTGWFRRFPALAVVPVVTWLFLSVVSPHTGLRHLVHLLPVIVFAAAIAANAFLPRMQELLLVAGLLIAHWGTPVLDKPYNGFVPAVSWILTDQSVPADRILVSSNWTGEGALISEFALHHPAPERTIVRASKVLQSSTWMGDGLTPLAHSAADIINILDRNQVTLVVVHEREAAPPSHYKAHLQEALANWQLVRRFDEVSIYQRPANSASSMTVSH